MAPSNLKRRPTVTPLTVETAGPSDTAFVALRGRRIRRMIQNPTTQQAQLQQSPSGPIPVRITNAFAVGFFGFLGAFAASLIFWIVGLVVLVIFGSIAAGVLHGITATPNP